MRHIIGSIRLVAILATLSWWNGVVPHGNTDPTHPLSPVIRGATTTVPIN